MTELTPVAIERKLRELVNALAFAQSALREARDAEVKVKHEYERKHRRTLLSSDTPKVTRGGWTTAERDAYVDEKCEVEREAYEIAEAGRKAAEDHLKTVRDQSMIVMALGKSVGAAYSMAGVS